MNERAGASAWLLVVAGAMNVLYSVLYGLWTTVPLVFVAFAMINSVLDPHQHSSVGQALGGFLFLAVVPALQIVGFFVTFVMGAVSMLGGLRLNQYRSQGLVWVGAISAIATPLIAACLNGASAFNLGSLGLGCLTGCLLGNIPTLFLFVFCLLAGILAMVHASSNGEKFARNGY